MPSPFKSLLLAATLYISFLCVLVTASPIDIPAQPHSPNHGIQPRQDPTDNTVGAEDETAAEIAADGTGPLRSAVNARSLFLAQPTATWYQVDVQSSDAATLFTSFQETTETMSIPPPSDAKQTQGPNPWNVDHIFALQVLGEITVSPTSVPVAAWTAASSAVFTAGPACTSIASQIPILQNLHGIPSALNGFKNTGPGATYYNFFGPGIQKSLQVQQTAVNTVITNVGNMLATIGGDPSVQTYFNAYANDNYQGAVEFLSTWTGKPFVRPATSTIIRLQPRAATTTISTRPKGPVLIPHVLVPHGPGHID
ncbi:hypothetical protein OEA41_007565 [Lepraria neglecta]|uniref:Uncharacterized protein n=1 Tax=Lepraria neglecta TaxID=209136 RepID=A0AAD9ZD06_9LECA|nr:hypothetical protein OEA41_007565 [Lepraria neglecta]